MKTYLLSIYQPDGPAPSPEHLEPIMRELGAIGRHGHRGPRQGR
jgi:hypothetical protein